MPTIKKIFCTTCQTSHLETQFTASRKRKNGLTGICKRCIRTTNTDQVKMGPAVLNKRISHHIEVNKKRHDMLMTRVRNLEEQVRKMEQSQPINQPASSCLPVGL
jgi:superfamily II helicase